MVYKGQSSADSPLSPAAVSHLFLPLSKETSKWRGHYLGSLYEYMQGCNKELTFLDEEQDKIKKRDWSDRMVDPPDVRRQYEVRIDQ